MSESEAKSTFLKVDSEWTSAAILCALAESIGADSETRAALERLCAAKEAASWDAFARLDKSEREGRNPDLLKPVADAVVTAFFARAVAVKCDIHLSSIGVGTLRDGVLECEYGKTSVTEAFPSFKTHGHDGAKPVTSVKFIPKAEAHV